MWRRLRRRTFAPARPAVLPEQIGLIVLSAIALVAGLVVVISRF
jgi:hypothetical protein